MFEWVLCLPSTHDKSPNIRSGYNGIHFVTAMNLIMRQIMLLGEKKMSLKETNILNALKWEAYIVLYTFKEIPFNQLWIWYQLTYDNTLI